jgi:hypothetical protein
VTAQLPPQNAAEARERMLDWAMGKLSWNNMGHELYDPQTQRGQRELFIAQMDAIEVQKWANVYAAMATAEQLEALASSEGSMGSIVSSIFGGRGG